MSSDCTGDEVGRAAAVGRQRPRWRGAPIVCRNRSSAALAGQERPVTPQGHRSSTRLTIPAGRCGRAGRSGELFQGVSGRGGARRGRRGRRPVGVCARAGRRPRGARQGWPSCGRRVLSTCSATVWRGYRCAAWIGRRRRPKPSSLPHRVGSAASAGPHCTRWAGGCRARRAGPAWGRQVATRRAQRA